MRNLLIAFFLSFGVTVFAQTDTVRGPVPQPFHRPHIIKFNPTPSLVWNVHSLMFGYERAIKPYQSFSASVGFLSLPGLVKERRVDTAFFQFARSQSIGYSVVLDYRFYLKKENTSFAPHGLYIAPYLAHHNHWWSSDAALVLASGQSIEADITSRLITIGVGGQIGYQFSFFQDKFTLDLITFAPSITLYKFLVKANSDQRFEFDEYYPEMADWLLDKYPWLQSLAKEELVEFTGTSNTASFGTRFVVQLGYRF